MSVTRRLLVHDALIGLAPLVVAGYPLYADGRVGAWMAGPLAAGALLMAAARYVDEHDLVPAPVRRVGSHPLAVIAVGLAVVWLLVNPILDSESAVIWELAAFLGAGLGFAGYRAVFGLVRPAPESARERMAAAESEA